MPEPPAPRSQGPAPRSRGPAQAPWLGVGKEQLGKDVAWLLLGGWAKAWGVVERRRDPGSGGGGKATSPRPRGWRVAELSGSSPLYVTIRFSYSPGSPAAARRGPPSQLDCAVLVHEGQAAATLRAAGAGNAGRRALGPGNLDAPGQPGPTVGWALPKGTASTTASLSST